MANIILTVAPPSCGAGPGTGIINFTFSPIPSGVVRTFVLKNSSGAVEQTSSRPANTGTEASFSNLPNDTYSLTATDTNGDTATVSNLVVNCAATPPPVPGQVATFDVVRYCHPDYYGGIRFGVKTTNPPSADGYKIVAEIAVLNEQNDNPAIQTQIFQSATENSGQLEFTRLPNAVYSIRLRDQSGATGGNSGLVIDCTQPPVIRGCTDPTAENYDPTATEDDGSCVYPVQLGDQLSFLPWVQHKLSRAATPGTSSRPTVELNVTTAVRGGGAASFQTTTQAELYGPGDVVGLNPAAVLRTTPYAGEQLFSPLQLAAIEFREEDLPWRYSPVADAGNRLQPWCFLLVLEEGEYSILEQGAAPLARIMLPQTATGIFPAADQLWPWAHVQVNQVIGTSEADVEAFLAGPLQRNPSLAYARLFSPRRLKEATRYHAFLIPTFEAGRLAGLGSKDAASATGISWQSLLDSSEETPTSLELPVYFQWEFQTGSGSDFESLARRLQPATELVTAPREVALETPLGPLTATPANYTLPLPGVLQPLTVSAPTATPPEVVRNLYQELQPGLAPTPTGSGRPIVAPPLYGRYYADSTQLTAPGTDGTVPATWLHEVNLDPRYRAVASLGSQVVQDKQEDYMQRAWDQVQDVLVANFNLRNMQAGLETTTALRDQHLPTTAAPASPAANRRATSSAATSALTVSTSAAPSLENYGLQLTALAFPRVRLAQTGLTVRETIRRSNVPLALFSPTFRRLTRPFGRYQINLVGRPLRPTQQPEPTTEDAPLGPGTSLRQRDALITQVQAGTVRASAPKSALFRAYQFDDAALNTLLTPGAPQPTNVMVLGNQGYESITDQATVEAFREALGLLRTQVRFRTVDPQQPPLDLDALKAGILAGTDPATTFTARAKRALRLVPRFTVGDWEPADFTAADFLLDEAFPTLGVATPPASRQRALAPAATSAAFASPMAAATQTPPVASLLKPVMAYPVFKDAMGDVLRQRHPELFLPGIEQFPANGVALMTINRPFIEAYMLGLNHALGSELLWREFPTDLRGSYFQQFWDVRDYLNTQPVADASPAALAAREGAYREVKPLAQWEGRLGENPASGSADRLVLVLRAELLQRFPNTVICAQPAITGVDGLQPDMTRASLYPVQRLPLGQDLTVLAFDLTQAQATTGDGYFFLLLERPGEPQFGLDETGPQDTAATLTSWNNLSWTYLGVEPGENLALNLTGKPEVTTGSMPHVRNGAELAYATFQQPAMVAIHARQLL